ncbi:PilN domain-containing protein [Thioalbus denitrificans]|uniref:General secretion pathway protein L n=1 Tax=Thioalbus denitrificans TaxID=547122 RepID=A0A369CBA9_9GAMM|nr:PilN domain-containing protein [Thioalbus denitrificans]RCX29927.1 general secretion pathway protein L [Thioalbus denitrificans]
MAASATRQGVISGFLHWWLAELRSLLPSLSRGQAVAAGHRVILDMETGHLRATECRGMRDSELGRFVLAPERREVPADLQLLLRRLRRERIEVVVRLPRAQVLVKTVALPAEAEENLREVLGFEMDRQTPFPADQVYYDYRNEGIDKQDGRLRVTLVVVPRSHLDRARERVEEWGLSLTAVTFDESGSGGAAHPCAPPAFNLWRPGRQERRSTGWGRLNRILGILALLLAVSVAALPLAVQKLRIAEVERRIEAVAADARSAQSLRDDIDRRVSETGSLLRQRRQTAIVIEVLRELTALIPDDTWLERFELKDGQVSIQGISADASALIGLLEGSALFENATFRSPVIRDPRSGRYRFQVVVSVSATAGGPP